MVGFVNLFHPCYLHHFSTRLWEDLSVVVLFFSSAAQLHDVSIQMTTILKCSGVAFENVTGSHKNSVNQKRLHLLPERLIKVVTKMSQNGC